jgi:hypothetical protein
MPGRTEQRPPAATEERALANTLMGDVASRG